MADQSRTDLNPAHVELELPTYKTQITRKQRACINLVLTGVGVLTLLQPKVVAFVGSYLFFSVFFLLLSWRGFLLLAGMTVRATSQDRPIFEPATDELPVYTILIPAYREVAIMSQIARAMRDLNWPPDKLDILVLLEADDIETIAAANRAAFPAGTRLCLVPSGGPRTKPNALNYGLGLALGEYLTVYDVEDFPDPDQLRTAFEAFRRTPGRVVCLQAPLCADNAHQSWFGAQWGLEYDLQFGTLLPGQSLYGMPLLLGGTSNHFRINVLRALGGWDAWNVTEDADLGIRLARAGWRSAMLNTVTYEDAPTDFPVWMAQRCRWIKGHIQTWLVHMRSPRKTLLDLGPAKFCAMQLSLGGGVLAPLCFLPCSLIVAIILLTPGLTLGVLGNILLAMGFIVGLISDLIAPGLWSRRRVFAMATRLVYWPLHSLAAYRAILELANDPFFWAKTPHHPRHAETGEPRSINPYT